MPNSIRSVHRFSLSLFLSLVNDRFQPTVIFPNTQDRSKYDYTASCATAYNVTGRPSDSLCACSPGYRFAAKDRACRRRFEEINETLLRETYFSPRTDSIRMGERCSGIRSLHTYRFGWCYNAGEWSLPITIDLPSTTRQVRVLLRPETIS